MSKLYDNSSYMCDVCKRSTHIITPTNSIGVLPKCNITNNCLGIMRKILVYKDIVKTPMQPTEVPGVQDWVQRKVFYTQNVTIARNVWRVEHNIGVLPRVYVYDTEENLVDEDTYTVTTINENVLEITFKDSTQREGIVQCVSSTSRNNYMISTPSTTQQNILSTAVSNATGELTIAVLQQTSITLNFVNLAGNVNPLVPITYKFSKPSTQSSWYGVENIFVNGKQYYVASFNVTQDPDAKSFFENNLVDNGARFYVDNSSHPELLFLLSNAPYTMADKNYNQYLDSATVSEDNILLTFTNNVASVPADYIKTAFPKIYEV